jgi:hypothetical protein
MGIGQSKEGFSVFGLMNKCVSPMGKRQLRLWFLRPIVNLQVLEERQTSIAAFTEAADLMKCLQVGTLHVTKNIWRPIAGIGTLGHGLLCTISVTISVHCGEFVTDLDLIGWVEYSLALCPLLSGALIAVWYAVGKRLNRWINCGGVRVSDPLPT